MKNGARTTRLVACLIVGSQILAGCATASHGIAPAYISPLQYSNYDCAQIVTEVQRTQTRVNQLAGRLDEAASNDVAIMSVGMVLFWPALFALGGTKQQEAEYARLTGELEALNKAAVEKRCSLPVAHGANETGPSVVPSSAR